MRQLVIGALLLASTVVASPPAQAAAVPATGPTSSTPATYSNPVSGDAVQTFPDPAMIRGKDGLWYAYGTTNPIDGKNEHILPMLKSPDMVHWTYAGDVYTGENHPSWWPNGTRPWAPDIRYVNGTYHLTYSLSTSGVGLATSPHPTGPWTDRGRIVPAGGSGCPTNNIDQAVYTDVNGDNYLYWGSYDTICVAKMNADATEVTGEVKQIGRGRRMEGGFVVRRDDWYYLFYSDAGCCDGAFSGYTVKVGRSDNPLGPFTTPTGVDLMDLTSKDGIVLAAGGNGWVGPGHNAIQTDLSGQDWLVYHAIPSSAPEFGPVTTTWGTTIGNLARRPLMIDRLDWIDGWPVVRAGAGPSTGEQPAPVTTWSVGSTFNSGTDGWKGPWKAATDPDSLGYLTTKGSNRELSDDTVQGDVRVEADLRLGTGGEAAGLVVTRANGADDVTAWLDREQGALVVTAKVRGKTTTASSPLPASFDYGSWQNVAAERRGNALVVSVSADRLGDPAATVAMTLPDGAPTSGSIGVAARGAEDSGGVVADADNVGAAPLYQPVTERVPGPVLGERLPAYSDEFDGTGTPTGWTRVRNPSATLSNGSLVWPTQNAELFQGTNTASILLRDAPAGDFAVETKLTFDGTRGNQQAGLLLYENDDRWLKLTHTVLPLNQGNGAVLHQTEFGKEGPRPGTTPPTAVANGPMFGGPAAQTTWLRLLYHYDEENGEHDVRMASSTDGTHWIWGGSWSLPRTGPVRIGLISMNTAGATATFDYLRTYEVTSR
ncbi:family 43 glycosylhydrolase [Microbispora sp. H13382]|uniref:family 43 glycosylhydrolase n=1 Tax=Microbispora sp. H13382 TaxID=2729112 RepID=UPI001C718F22|nr:family 43 glycosylhydrolase [Microbispora sp. H13382]